MHLACPPSITMCQPQSLAGAAGTSRFPAPARDPTFGLFLSPCRKDSRLLFVCFVLRRAGPPLPRTPCSALGASPCPAADIFLPCKLLWAVLRWSSASLLLCACHFSLPDSYYFLLEFSIKSLLYSHLWISFGSRQGWKNTFKLQGDTPEFGPPKREDFHYEKYLEGRGW